MEKLIKVLPLDDVESITSINGGDVNETYRLRSDGKDYFLKVQKNTDESFFAGERAGLEIFEREGINAPRVLASGSNDGSGFMLLTYHKEDTMGSQEDLARLVAKIHTIESPNGKFGFDYPYRGAGTIFTNEYKDTWKEIFLEQRMDKLRDELASSLLWDKKDLERYDQVRKVIEKELDSHKSRPVLLHGDLWAGNFMFDEKEKPLVFDPNPLYGDREFDIGISTVFGGFGKIFYKAYRDELPLYVGWERRINFYRLYLLMVHLLKFGPVYDSSVNDVMKNILN
ncbi:MULTISPECIES: fructosamine kinase family protein [Anaerococcus]|uniref:Fructosamine kinase family protein n=1 Tax=Anaerococcus kampingae TaxID=3115614 RepID=A0ABW9MDV9_9FIRM|nr:fructosamine kinase family protein [Anaerococcus sp. Marseille-P3915]